MSPGLLERRERHPGGVQQEKLMVLSWTLVTSYDPNFMTNTMDMHSS